MKYIIFSLMILLGISCNFEKEVNVTLLVKEWSGKEIIFPKDTFSFRLNSLYSNFKILVYTDSLGCTSCKLRPRQWQKIICEIDSISDRTIPFIFYFNPKDKEEINNILKRDNFNHPVCIDEADSLNKLNHFPADMRFQTFLLDKNNKVLAIGNPIHNPKVKELYMKIILGDKAPKKKDEIKTIAEMGTSFIDFGEFDWKVEQKATFKLKNTGAQPLVILDVTTSCGCISVEFPKEPLAVGKEAEIAVVYKADKPEHFNKTVTVYCNAENAPFTVKVTGTAK